MLVLLIIFMVAAPMLTTGVDVSLPESRTGKSLESEAITVSLARDGRLQYEKRYVEEGMLKKLLREQATAGRKRPVMVRADQNIPYGRVIDRGGRHPGGGVHPGGLRHAGHPRHGG